MREKINKLLKEYGDNNANLSSFGLRKQLTKAIVSIFNLNELQELIVDLDWEYDRMSSSGKESYDKICEKLNIK